MSLNCVSGVCLHLVVCVELLVLPLALPEGLPLGLQRLGQVGVFQTLLGILIRQHFNLPLERAQLLPETRHGATANTAPRYASIQRSNALKVHRRPRNSNI